MNIRNIRIDGFGVWVDKTWEDLSPGLNVFHGPNEAGKSTPTAFVRAMLFGFDRRGSPRRYEPLNGGAHGGWLDLNLQDRSVRIERKPGRHVRGTTNVYDGDTVGGEELLAKLLNGTTRTLYHNVFAFGLEELEQFHTLQETEVAQHITGAGLGIGAARWTGVQRDIEERQSALFLPRGQSSSISVALKELEGVREELDRTQHEPEDYWAAHEMKARLAGQTAGLEEALTDLKQRVRHYENRLKSRPLRERRRKIEERLLELTVVDSFPEGGIERLDLMRRQAQALEAECDRLQCELENRRLRRIELNSWSDPEDYGRRVRVVESLRTLLPRMDAVRRVYAAAMERRNTILQERTGLESALENLRPPSKSVLLLFLVLIWIGAAGLAGAGHGYIAAATLLVSLSPLLWYRRRIATVTLLAGRVKACLARLNGSALDIQTVEREACEIEAEMGELTGKTEITQQDIDVRVAELDLISKVSDEIRRLDESSERAGEELQRVRNQIEELRKGGSNHCWLRLPRSRRMNSSCAPASTSNVNNSPASSREFPRTSPNRVCCSMCVLLTKKPMNLPASNLRIWSSDSSIVATNRAELRSVSR